MLVQLSGVPASGKSTLAYQIAHTADLVVVNTDVLKSALIGSGLPVCDAGRATAHDAGVRYSFIELWAPDVAVLLPRLDARVPRVSQVASAMDPVPGTTWEFGTAEATPHEWQGQLLHPLEGWLRLDATHEPADNLQRALQYLDRDGASTATGNAATQPPALGHRGRHD